MGYFDGEDKIDKWHQARRAKFTSSEQWKLLPTKNQPKDQLWSPTAKTHIETKAIEASTKFFERPEMDEVEALRHGKINEYPAFERYVKETNNKGLVYLGDENPLFIPCKNKILVDESGGTPDVVDITGNDDSVVIDFGAEIKNPYNPAYHFRRLKWKDQWDVKEGYPSCYAQIQDLMRITGALEWDFISFDERQFYRSAQIKIITIKQDKKFIDNLELRTYLAVKEKYKSLSDHIGVEVKSRKDFIKILK